MKKLLCIFCLMFMLTINVNGATNPMTNTYGNYTLLEEFTERPVIADPLHNYVLVWTNEINTVVELNLYDLVNSQENLGNDEVYSVNISTLEEYKGYITVYHNGNKLRRLPIQEGSYAYFYAAGYRLWIKGYENGNELKANITLQEPGDELFFYDKTVKRVTFSGQVKGNLPNKTVNFMLVPKDAVTEKMPISDIVYMRQVYSDIDGRYIIDFPFEGDISEYKAVLNVNGTHFEIEDAKTVTSPFVYDMSINRGYIGGKADALAEISVSLFPIDAGAGLESYENIARTTADSSGNYTLDFVFKGDITKYKAEVRENGVVEEFGKATLIDTNQTSQIKLAMEKNGNEITAHLVASNAFMGENEECVLMLAFYDSESRMIKLSVGENYQKSVTAEIPVGAEYAKAYAWRDMNSPLPYTVSKQMQFNG